MELLFIILLILAGILLLVMEILILPGLIAGIIGGAFILVGNLWIYSRFGNTAGNITALASVILASGAVYFSLKSKAWQRFGLNDSLQGKATDVQAMDIHEGDEGVAVSALRPMGTVMIRNQKVEAQTNGEFIDGNDSVIVLKIFPNKILVKSKSLT